MKERVPIEKRSAGLRWYYRKAGRLAAANLTSRGTVSRYRRYPELAGLTGAARKAKWQQLYRAERVARGLTVRGSQRVHGLHEDFSGIDRLIFRAEIDQAAAAIGRVFKSMPPSVQAELVKVAATLGRIRRRLLV